MPPRLVATVWRTATVLSPDGLGIAKSPAGSVSGVNTRPTPKPGDHVRSSAPPGTRSCFPTTAPAAGASTASSVTTISILFARDIGDLRELGVVRASCSFNEPPRSAPRARGPRRPRARRRRPRARRRVGRPRAPPGGNGAPGGGGGARPPPPPPFPPPPPGGGEGAANGGA